MSMDMRRAAWARLAQLLREGQISLAPRTDEALYRAALRHPGHVVIVRRDGTTEEFEPIQEIPR